jgi:UDP-glucose 4-epimerase
VGKTLGDFSKAVKKILPVADIEIGPGLDYLDIGHNVYSIFDITRARKELKFNPEFDLEKSVQDYVETMNLLNIEPVYTP